jgi:hypothetical protein
MLHHIKIQSNVIRNRYLNTSINMCVWLTSVFVYTLLILLLVVVLVFNT